MSIPTIIHESKSISAFAPFTSTLNDEIILDIKSGDKNIYLSGFIEYRGAHLKPSDPPYQTIFKFKWEQFDMLGYSGYWQTIPKENKQT